MHMLANRVPSRRGARTRMLLTCMIGVSVLLPSADARAQSSPDTARAPRVGGLIFSHFRYGGDSARRSSNRFDIERAYIDVRAPLGGGLSARATADVFQQTDSARAGYYGGWAFRAKYAWLQYDVAPSAAAPLGIGGFARFGLISTVIVEVADEYWPRFISKSPVDRHSFMSTADAGAAMQFHTAHEHLEFLATVTNGEGYQRSEVDRFKDYAARLRLRPLATMGGWARGLSVTPWASVGDRGSRFSEGPGTVEPVSRGLDRNLWGIHTALPVRGITIGGEFSQRRDETESADTLVDATPTFGDRTTEIVSGFIVMRPFALFDSASTIPLGIVARFDRLTTDALPDADANVVIAGVTWDLGRRASLALDYQEESPQGGYPLPSTRTWYLHTVVRF